ncbi:Sjogren's syndrome/scleroderma autoantigen 1 family protein [Halorubrum sp. N11]|uniref:Sjogren's syndrome/scleroderma autoantigen 1 family protein n=1 Tax=Halorubrum sp. N11 TaxID=3402276 RepID=UPI003EBC84A0
MSDGFDKEAEREKLREKLADDDEKREHTQRMSELLLQGATMTNRHCDDCGDPIFRHDGQEFCPTCHATGADDGAQGGVQSPDANATPSQGDTQEASAPPTAERTAPSDASQDATSPATTDPTAADRNAATPRAASPPAEKSRDEPRTAPSAGPAETGTVADARASLTRTLARFARAAEETDDPRRARDHLQAAREAAEALAALD